MSWNKDTSVSSIRAPRPPIASLLAAIAFFAKLLLPVLKVAPAPVDWTENKGDFGGERQRRRRGCVHLGGRFFLTGHEYRTGEAELLI